MLSVEAFLNEALAHQHSATNNFALYHGKEVTKGPFIVVNTLF